MSDFSEHGEKLILTKIFKDRAPRGRFLVDVGAFGRENSNTYHLLLEGWKGLMIEPSPDRFRICMKDFAGLLVEILPVAVGPDPGRALFYLHTVAGHDSLLGDWYPSTIGVGPVWVDVQRLEKILEERKVAFDFDLLSIDAEGADEMILKGFFKESLYRPRVVITEVTSYRDIIGFFKSWGYELYCKCGDAKLGNAIFLR